MWRLWVKGVSAIQHNNVGIYLCIMTVGCVGRGVVVGVLQVGGRIASALSVVVEMVFAFHTHTRLMID